MVFLVILWISFYRRELSTRGLLETFTCLFHLNQCQGLGVQTIVSKETVMSPNRSNFIHICSILFEDLGTGGRELSNCDLKYFYIKTSMAIFQVNLLCRKSGKTGRYMHSPSSAESTLVKKMYRQWCRRGKGALFLLVSISDEEYSVT